MSDIRFNQWLHQSGTGGVSQVASGAVGVGTTNPLADFYVRGDAQITGILTAGHIAMGSSITFGDDDRAYFGDGTDLQIYHSGSHSFIQDTGTGNLFIDSNSVQIRNAVASKTTAKFIENAQVELYYNNTERIRTTNTGAVVTGILTATGMVKPADGILINGGNISLLDRPDGSNHNLFFGTGARAAIYHDGSGFSIVNNTGHSYIGVGVASKDLYLYAQASGNVLLQQNTGVRYVKGVGSDASVQLFFNNNEKLKTINTGIDVTGAITADDLRTDNSQTFYLTTANDFRFRHTGGSERLRIDSSGRLRVASTTESADGAFDDVIVGNYSGNRGISILSGSSSQGALGFAKNGTMADGYVAYNHNSTATNSSMILKSQGKIQFNAGSTEKLRIDADGHVTVTDGSLIAQNTGAGSGTSQLQLQPYGTQGYINHTGSSHLYLRMGSSFAQRFIFRNDGDLEISDGNLRVASGHGIDFSATADSGGTKENELLDDYEEGTFTPTFYYVSGTSNVSYTTQEGRYTKIGRLVSISIKMSISNIGSGNNNMRVGGLPFAPVNSGVSYDYFNFSAVVGMNIGSGRVPFAQLEDYGGGGRITMYSYDYSSSSNYSEINSSHLSNGLNFGMSGTYVTS
tara:strand:+ start:206 stop:2095 length:1890 start_codon:yes stop_codon:yes gene_type:complete